MDVEKAAIKSLKDAGGFYEDPVAISREVDDILKRRSVSKGCGRVYYDCPQIPDTEHKVRTCNKWVYRYDAHLSTRPPAKSKCVEPYRRCMGHTFDHNNRVLGSSKHSDDGSDSDEEANAGGTLHACNIHDTSVSGDHSSTWLCNESPCSNRQVPYCLAICPETGNHGTATTPTTPAMVVCDIAGCQDSTPYDPTSSSAGLHAYCNECSQYKCTGGGHSWYPSCTDTTHTNSNDDSCTVAGYECVSHTPVYPAATTVTAPVWSDIPDPYNLTVGDSFTLDLNSYVTGSPTITRNGGVIPAGLSFRNGIVSGRVSRVESRSFRFTATNAAGSTVSEWVNITVEAAQ